MSDGATGEEIQRGTSAPIGNYPLYPQYNCKWIVGNKLADKYTQNKISRMETGEIVGGKNSRKKMNQASVLQHRQLGLNFKLKEPNLPETGKLGLAQLFLLC